MFCRDIHTYRLVLRYTIFFKLNHQLDVAGFKLLIIFVYFKSHNVQLVTRSWKLKKKKQPQKCMCIVRPEENPVKNESQMKKTKQQTNKQQHNNKCSFSTSSSSFSSSSVHLNRQTRQRICYCFYFYISRFNVRNRPL